MGDYCPITDKLNFNNKLKIMPNTTIVLEAMNKAGQPVRTGDILDLCGLDRQEVEKAMKELKAEEKIVSPKRCFWEPAK
jgi:chromosome segregation and condensation protein ScpB